MSELAMTVAVGVSHPNSGLVGNTDLFGALYVGGSGAWVFTPVSDYPAKPVRIGSSRNLIPEIRAAIALALGLGEARTILESDPENHKNFLDGQMLHLEPEMLKAVGAESKDKSTSLFCATDPSLADDVREHLDEPGWSVVLCVQDDRHLETQWDHHPAHKSA